MNDLWNSSVEQIPGSMPADEIAERLTIAIPKERSNHTAAGFVLVQVVIDLKNDQSRWVERRALSDRMLDLWRTAQAGHWRKVRRFDDR
jgi:hypothetical protein